VTSNLKKITINALFWSFIERFGQQLIQFVTSVILARILLPEDFGLVAMLAIFFAFGMAFIDSGFQKALVQKKELTQVDESSVFYFNVFISILLASIMIMVAPLIGEFYGQPKLIQITRMLSLTLIFSSLGLVQDALLARSLNFKVLFKVNISSYILSGVISTYMALSGFGVWSIVFLQVGSSLFRTVFLWAFNIWRPGLHFSLTSIKSMFSFGSRLFIVSLTNSVFTNIYQVIIGKFFSASSLGFYSRAKTLSMYPVTVVTSVVNQVSFPVFSKIQDDKNQLKNYMQKSLTMLTMVTFPLMIGVAVSAKPLIIVLLTEKWLPSVPYFQMLCIVGMLYPIHVINLNALNARGRSDLYLKIDIVNKALIVLIVFITFRFGISAMIIGQIVHSFLVYYFFSYYSGKHLNYTIINQLKDMGPSFSAALLMGILVYSLKFLIIENDLVLLIGQVLSGMFIYTGLCYVFKIESFFRGLEILKSYNYFNLKNATQIK